MHRARRCLVQCTLDELIRGEEMLEALPDAPSRIAWMPVELSRVEVAKRQLRISRDAPQFGANFGKRKRCVVQCLARERALQHRVVCTDRHTHSQLSH